jgi:hypothetical protein
VSKFCFELSIVIQRPAEDVFSFLRDKDQHVQKPGSPVLSLEKITGGATGVGTRYREVVQMMPFVRGEILSAITRFDPPRHLEEDFTGAGMTGHLSYQFIAEGDRTKLIQHQEIQLKGLLYLLQPLFGVLFSRRLSWRLNGIKAELEQG